MIYGVVGTLDRDTMMKFGLYNIKTGRFQRPASKKGNGKTMVLTYYGFRESSEEGRKVYSNFHTKFSEYKTAQDIFDDLGRILDLAGKYGAYGTTTDIIKNFSHIFAHYPLSQIQQTELYELRALYLEYFGCLILLTEFQKFFNSLGTSTKTIKWIESIMTQLRKLSIDLMWDSQRPISAGNRTREYTETYLVPQKYHADDFTPCDMDICNRDHLIYVFSDVPFREKELCILDCKEVGKLYETDEVIGDNLVSPIEKSKEDKEKSRKRMAKRKQDPGTEPEKPAPEIPSSPPPGSGDPPRPANDPDEEGNQIRIEILERCPEIPVFIKSLLPKFQEKGKIKDVFEIYFRGDRLPAMPEELDELLAQIGQEIKHGD